MATEVLNVRVEQGGDIYKAIQQRPEGMGKSARFRQLLREGIVAEQDGRLVDIDFPPVTRYDLLAVAGVVVAAEALGATAGVVSLAAYAAVLTAMVLWRRRAEREGVSPPGGDK